MEQILDLKVKVTGNENVKIVFHVYIRQKWVDLHQTKTKMTNVHRSILYTYRRDYILRAEIFRFCDTCLIICEGMTACRSGRLAVHLQYTC